jgi:transcriptional regulator with XRE-family HTH domain
MQRYRATVRVEISGHEVGDMVASHSYPLDGEVMPAAWMLSIHPERATERSVLHELAHVLAPRFELCSDIVTAVPPHGPHFAGVYVEMLGQFSRQEDPTELVAAMKAFGVRWLSPDEWRGATAQSLSIEQDLIDGRRFQVPILRQHFGAELRRCRVDLGWTRAQLGRRAKATAAVVTRVETGGVVAPGDRLLALRLAACSGVDPVLIKEAFGLGWDEGELTELRALAPEWAAVVDEMDELLRRRPPWWEPAPQERD